MKNLKKNDLTFILLNLCFISVKRRYIDCVNFKQLILSSLDLSTLDVDICSLWLVDHFNGSTSQSAFVFVCVVSSFGVVESNLMLLLNEVINITKFWCPCESNESKEDWNNPEESS